MAIERKIENLFFKSVKQCLCIDAPQSIKEDPSSYKDKVSAFIENTDLVYKMKRGIIMKTFAKRIHADPIISYKEVFDHLMLGPWDPIIRLKFDSEYRERFLYVFLSIS